MESSRRSFFLSLPAIAALPASWTAFAGALRAAPSSPDNEAYWGLVKRQFPLADDLLYLNAANVCPASRPVLDRHAEYMRDFQSNPSFQNRAKYEAMRERLREKIAALLRANADEIAITRNTSEGTNIIVKGVDLKPGDEVLITDHNHPSNSDSWKVRAQREGFTVTSLPVRVPAASREELISQFEKAVTPRTTVIAVTHVTSTTGIMYPAHAIAEIARKRGIWMHLDGAQTFGALDVNLKEIGCDSYSASAHKWMMGPLEAGVLFVRAERIPSVWPSIVTAGWTDHLKGARKLEVYGQRDDPRIVALESAVDFVQLIGMNAVESRMRFLATSLKEQLSQIGGVRLKTNLEPELSGGVVKADIAKVPTKQAYDTLWEKHRISIAMTPSGDAQGLRFSPHIYNSRHEIERAAEAVKALAS
ncbi:MAG TPA: aminotransferase class V-fold PLP-dependent enzyme [Bryobacteraceae bacterium]|nr:aminotransferase class V-fold PLP-dependent enzyme [Bryobacteraceae bacterium]